MKEAINQCCYTHIGSWTTVALKGVFEQKYIGELSRHSTLPGAEYGENLCVFETVGDGDKFLVMRTQYGLRDFSTESGRASMFSHGYLLDVSCELFDPNVFLTIHKDNFCINAEDANKERTEYIRQKQYTIKAAMDSAGLTKDSFSKLVKCIYQLSVRSINKRALYIKSKNEEQSLALLYCIYAAFMPRYGRFLSSSSSEYNFSDMRNIVFASDVDSSKKYFIPETGENNVLSINVEKNIDSLNFVDYGVKNFNSTEDIQGYYLELEKTLDSIVSSKQIDDNVLRLAHVMTADPQPSKDSDIVSNDEALLSILDYAKEYNETNKNDLVQKYIEKLQAEAISRGIIKIDVEETNNIAENINGTFCPYQDISELHTLKSDKGLDTFPKVENITIHRPFSEREKQDFCNSLEKLAKGGTSKFDEMAKLLDKFVANERVLNDKFSRAEFANIIYNSLCTIVTRSLLDKNPSSFNDNPLLLFEKWCLSLKLDYSEIDRYRIKLIAQFWKEFKWETYSLMKRKDYLSFAIHDKIKNYFTENGNDLLEKSNCVNDIVSLEMNITKYLAENKMDEWLYELNTISVKYRGIVDKRLVGKILTSYYASQRITDAFFNDLFIKSYIVKYSIYLNRAELEKALFVWKQLYSYISCLQKTKKRNVDDEICVIKSIEALSDEKFSSDRNKEHILGFTYNFFIHLEKSSYAVPFDFWIALGRGYTDNPFEVFYKYEYEPKITEVPPKEIIRSSSLLKDCYYIDNLLLAGKISKSSFIKNLIKLVDDGGKSGISRLINRLKSKNS